MFKAFQKLIPLIKEKIYMYNFRKEKKKACTVMYILFTKKKIIIFMFGCKQLYCSVLLL